MTLQEILNYVDRKKPNSESNANKVIDLNKLQLEIFTKLNALSYNVKMATDTTVADQSEYDLPTNCRIENVRFIEVETYEDSGEYDKYYYDGPQEEVIRLDKIFKRGSTNLKYSLLDDQSYLGAADLTIKVYYYPRPSLLSAGTLGATPDLEEEYHPLLCYGLIVELCNQGNYPDVEMANYYQSKYDEFFRDVISNLENNNIGSGSLRVKEVKERW